MSTTRHALILWRKARERAAPLAALIEAFQTTVQATLCQLDDEAQALAETPFLIGHIAVGCAPGYLDYRFGTLWVSLAITAKARGAGRPQGLAGG